ncbi:MAG: DEAD/DEAH box helicase [Bacteroidota bacterium]
MRKTYGNTWWGKQWLRTLQNIDDANRLPRGRTYANTGRVSTIDVSDHQVFAKVQGRRPRPYAVSIQLEPFTEQEKNQLLDSLIKRPFLLTQLLSREIPQGLAQLCDQLGISLFPENWGDVEGECSCPDWAVPCKHLAAVLYLIANEIDNQPLLLFELRGLDLLGELAKRGQHEMVAPTEEIIVLEDLLLPEQPDYSFFEWSPAVLQGVDLSAVPNTLPSLLAVLSSNPPFYPLGDFTVMLERGLHATARGLRKSLRKSPQETSPLGADRVEHLEIVLDGELQLQQFVATDYYHEPIFQFFKLSQLVGWLDQLPLHLLENYSISLRGLVLTYHLAQRLCEKQALMPELIELSDGVYGLRWLPAYFNQQVWEITDLVNTLVYPGMLRVERAGTPAFLDDDEVFPTLLSLFTGFFVHLHRNLDYRQETHPVNQLFFVGRTQKFREREFRDYPATIGAWLAPLALGGGEHQLIIQITDDMESGFSLALIVRDERTDPAATLSLQQLLQEEAYEELQVPVLRDLAMTTKLFPQLAELIDDPNLEELRFAPDDFADILLRIIPVVEIVGVEILMPKALRKLLRPQASLSVDANADVVSRSGIISLDQMLQFKWQVALGEELVDLATFEQLLATYRGIIKINDQYVHFEEQEIKKLLDQLAAPPELKPMEAIHIALSEEYERTPISLSTKAKDLLHSLFGAQTIAPPASLLATLRPYQQRGFEWLYKNSRLGLGSIIADDMGLGKTLQVIATLLQLKSDGAFTEHRAIVIVPTTLLSNWEREIQKFAPSLTVVTYYGSQRKWNEQKHDYDVLLSTYGVVRSDIKKLSKHRWTAVILDEAQQIKNAAAAQTKATKKLQAPVRIAMSGTPVENRLSEYWSLFDFTNKGYLGSLTHFKKEIAKPIETTRDQHQLRWFRRITAPFILRRLKTDKKIINDLPEKVETDQFVRLSDAQAALYQSVVDSHLEKVEQSEGIERRGLILKLITALKQICNHPRQFLKKGSLKPEDSGKVQFLYSLLHQLLERGEKALIFTQYREMGELLGQLIEAEFGLQAPFLHGGVRRKERDRMVETFQQDRHTPLFLLSLKAGGTGLNLTAASQVIHFDLWWNPAVEAQATDRAFRIGQTKNVFVHRFITQNTFEEKINQLLQGKKELADLAVAQGEKWIGELSNHELRDLVQLD